jgi:hypothetical protein
MFISRDRAAELLGMSVGGVVLAMERGELDGLFVRVGRRTLFCLPAMQLRALGVTDVGAFCRSLGIADLQSLLAFLGGSQPAPTGSRNET